MKDTELYFFVGVIVGVLVTMLPVLILKDASQTEEQPPTDLQCLSIVIAKYPELIKTP